MPFMTRAAKSTAAAPKPGVRTRWGDPGVSETFVIQDQQLAVTPTFQQINLADAGILSELHHHINGPATMTVGTGSITKDAWGPHNIINFYQFLAGANTPLVSLSGKMLGILQTVEFPGRSWEAVALPADVLNPLTNTSDFFNFPATTGTFRDWLRVPLALKWVGIPGGAVGYVILQNKRIQNIVKPTFNVNGAAAPFNLAGAAPSPAGGSPYLVTGNATVTGTLTMETWKRLHTVPDSREKMPIFGFTRYLQEFQQPFSGSSFTYNFEPGGVLLRALFYFVDGTLASQGIATANVNTITYQYGTNKQLDVYTPQRNILEQLDLYGRTLPQACYVFDYYTAKRNLVDAKSTENTANVQVVASFASGFNPTANSTCYILLDKLFVVQNYLGH